MTAVAALEALALVAVVFLMLRHQRQGESAWTLERRELLTRIQRPEQLPVPAPVEFLVPDQDDDEIGLIGVIQEPRDDQ